MPDASPTPLLRVRELSITHDGNERPSPSDVSFDVHPGEVVLVLGPSGSGKSTLALALNGLIPHDIPATVTGTIEVQGVNAADSSPAELSPRVAMVFQDPDAQQVTGSLVDEVAFGPENLLLPVREVLERTERSLRRVGLWARRYANPDELSGGGRQRLAIACALAMGAPVLVLDEPTANLDPVGVEEVYRTLGEVVGGGDRAVVLVEHNLDQAIGFATRIIALDADGRVAVDGPVETVLREHAGDLQRLGVWLPTATRAGLALRAAGTPVQALPTTPAELREVLPPRAESATTVPRPADAAAAVQVHGLTLTRDGRPVLHDVSLTIPEGSFTAIVGGNGAGKTTLLQAIAGVLQPPKGTVRVRGIDPARASGAKIARTIGFVFQNPEHQFIAPTVADELAFGLRRQRLPAAEVDARVAEVLERFGLADKAHMHPFLLSGGQKRRLSVGTALMSAAPILALDEPTFGQDHARAAELLDLLTDLNRGGTTVIMVTHDMQLVADSATHTIVLGDGRVRAAGPTREVFADDETVRALGLRRPALPAAVGSVPGYAHVWNLADLTTAVTP